MSPLATRCSARELLVNIHLHSDRFSVETEMTVKLAKLGVRIYEVPIVYHGRTYAEGKKISWSDGVMALRDLVEYRFTDRRYRKEWAAPPEEAAVRARSALKILPFRNAAQ